MRLSRNIALTYFALGIVYIAASDVLLSLYHGRPIDENFEIVSNSIVKGWLFITITAILLYVVLNKYIKRLNDERKLLQTVIDNTRDLLWMIDSDSNILLANRAFVGVLGRESLAEITGKSALQFAMDDEDRSKWQGYYRRAIQREEFSVTEVVKGENVMPLEFEFCFYPVQNGAGKIDKVVCFGHNITELKKIQAEIETQNEVLREITWIQSHELRKPLANIRGLVGLIDGEQIDGAKTRELLSHLGEESRQLDKIIRKIVDRAVSVERKSRL